MRAALSPALVLLAAPAVAQDGPSFDCAKAESSAEELVCADADLATLDRRVADRYVAALEVIRGLDSGAAEAEDDLRATQRGWIGGRDECWKAEDLRDCVAWSYQRREAELVTQWTLEDPVSTVEYLCEDQSAFAVMIFETELPSLRIERGDRISTATLSPTGSGARYDAEFGAFLWMQGDEAIYRSPDPDGVETTCRVAG